MATVEALVDRVCQDTGLDNSTGAGGERSVALDALNEAYETIAAESGLNIDEGSVSLTEGTYKYDIIGDLSITDREVFNSFWLSDGTATKTPLQRVKMDKMRRLLEGTLTNSTPIFYAMRGNQLWLSPPPAANTTLFYEYTKTTPELVESSASGTQETTPSLFPASFHRKALAKLAVAIVLENYEGREDVAALHRRRADDEIARINAWSVRVGGIEGPRDTPKNRIRIRGNDVY